ncbi:hypothetical protein JHU04_000861 [Brenneria sp. 4F2]|nr:hypothetical protein [Brenneria bubanii]
MYPIFNGGKNETKYYLTAKLKFTAGVVNNHYIRFQMWGNNYVLSPDELNKEYSVFCEFSVIAGNSDLNKLIVHIGNDSAVSSSVSVAISEMALTTGNFIYLPNYAKSQMVV